MFIFLSVFVFESRICDLILSVSVTVFTIYSVLLDTMGKCGKFWGTWEWKRGVTERKVRKGGEGWEGKWRSGPEIIKLFSCSAEHKINLSCS